MDVGGFDVLVGDGEVEGFAGAVVGDGQGGFELTGESLETEHGYYYNDVNWVRVLIGYVLGGGKEI